MDIVQALRGARAPTAIGSFSPSRIFFAPPGNLLIMRHMQSGLVLLIFTLLSVVLCGCLQTASPEKGGERVPIVPPTESFIQAGTGDEVVITVTNESPGKGSGNLPFLPGGEYRAGDRILLAATTILSPENHVLVEVIPVSFGPVRKSDSATSSGISGVVEVRPGEQGLPNTWSFLIDTGGWGLDDYLVKVQGIEVPGYTATFRFTIAP
ncbi:MAG: hypothetical protein MUC66_07010 [Methanolinea sp.]|nr:hypothetical protein [Methanolinea sp.]